MEYKVLCTLMITLMLALSVLTEETSEICNVEPKKRTNCGWPGVTEKECKAKSCCFNDSVSGAPWCFYPEGIDIEEECTI